MVGSCAGGMGSVFAPERARPCHHNMRGTSPRVDLGIGRYVGPDKSVSPTRDKKKGRLATASQGSGRQRRKSERVGKLHTAPKRIARGFAAPQLGGLIVQRIAQLGIRE